MIIMKLVKIMGSSQFVHQCYGSDKLFVSTANLSYITKLVSFRNT